MVQDGGVRLVQDELKVTPDSLSEVQVVLREVQDGLKVWPSTVRETSWTV